MDVNFPPSMRATRQPSSPEKCSQASDSSGAAKKLNPRSATRANCPIPWVMSSEPIDAVMALGRCAHTPPTEMSREPVAASTTTPILQGAPTTGTDSPLGGGVVDGTQTGCAIVTR